MNNNEFEYYLIESDSNYTSPVLMNDDDVDDCGTDFLDDGEPVDENVVTHLIFNPPIPPQPQMTDYLYLEARAVFSKKVCDIIKNIDISDFQLVPAVIKGPKGEEYSDYWIANIYKEYAFLDNDKSEKASVNSKGRWSMIKKMVINREEMAKVPLEERLMYVGKESSAYVFYHKSIVDAIMSVNPTGLVFVPVEEWSQGAQFDR
jgi:hypothetical protein